VLTGTIALGQEVFYESGKTYIIRGNLTSEAGVLSFHAADTTVYIEECAQFGGFLAVNGTVHNTGKVNNIDGASAVVNYEKGYIGVAFVHNSDASLINAGRIGNGAASNIYNTCTGTIDSVNDIAWSWVNDPTLYNCGTINLVKKATVIYNSGEIGAIEYDSDTEYLYNSGHINRISVRCLNDLWKEIHNSGRIEAAGGFSAMNAIAYNSGFTGTVFLARVLYNSGTVRQFSGDTVYNIGSIGNLYMSAGFLLLPTLHNAGSIHMGATTSPPGMTDAIINSWIGGSKFNNYSGGTVLAYDEAVLSVGSGAFAPTFIYPVTDFPSCVCGTLVPELPVAAPMAHGSCDYNAGSGDIKSEFITGGKPLIFHIGANSGQNMTVFLGSVATARIGSTDDISGDFKPLSRASVLTQRNADAALKVIDGAIHMISDERTNLGTIRNRLAHTIKNPDNTSENMQGAESRIRDADMAKTAIAFAKNQIMTNVAQAVLAQAKNVRRDASLSLLA
jgi:flagellin-like hook-associated protein FlgL